MRTIDWVDGQVVLLDQTLLPDEERLLRIDSVDGLIDAISRLAIRGAPALGAAGALGVLLVVDEAARCGWDEAAVADALKRLRDARPTAVNLARGVDRVAARLRDGAAAVHAEAEKRSIPAHEIIVRGASRDEVPRFLAAGDLGISFIMPVFSKIASSPTKMGEMIAVGLPIVANGGVGDVARIIAETECGAVIQRFDAASYARPIEEIERSTPTPQERRERALAVYDVALGIDRYDGLYRKLALTT